MVGRIYTDTSVIGGCEDEEFRVHSRRLMDAFIRGDLRLVLSELTLRELVPAPLAVRKVLASVPAGHIEVVRLTPAGVASRNQAIRRGYRSVARGRGVTVLRRLADAAER